MLTSWAADGSLGAAVREALRLDGESAQLTALISQWAAGDFSALPPIEVLEGSVLPGAAGAYAISTGTIYLNGDWLASASEDRVIAVLTEELGHHLDGLLNASDTPGDEGELFAALVNRQSLDEAALFAMNNQDDETATIVDDQAVQVESASATAIEALNKLLGVVGIVPPSGKQYLAGECVSFVKRYTQELGIYMGTMGVSSQNVIYNGGAECGFRNFNTPGNSLTAAQADKIVYTGGEVPQIGDIIFFDNSTWGHVAVIQNVLDNRRVIVQESNTDGKPTSQSRVVLREINLNTVTTRGQVMGWLRLKNITIGGNPSLPPVSSPSLTPIATIQLPYLVGDLNGNGQKDIVYRRPNGDIKGVLLDSEGKFNWAFRVGSADKNLPVVGIGDINGDGRDDVIFRASNGDVTSFRTNTSGAAYEYYKVGGADANLPIIGVSDITGDGRAEIIFRAPNGDVNAFRNGSDGVAFQYYKVGGAGADLPVVAIGDVSGDRRSEVIFRASNGDVNAFRIGADGVATQYYRVGFADPSIKVVGIGDITGDGRGEVIFRAPNGDVGAFLIGTDGVATLYYKVGWADPSLPIVGIGDITGDGRSEILFRQPNGYLAAFRINSSGIADLYYQTDVVDPAAIDFGYSTPTITVGLQASNESDLGWQVPEGNSGSTTIIFDVSVDNASGDTVSVNYSTDNITALAGRDYTAASGTLAFTAGQKVKQVSISVTGNALFEPDKSFRFVLSNAVGGKINNSVSDVTILNDDAPIVSNGSASFAIIGTSSVGQTLTASKTADDPDGNGSFSYLWQSSADGNSWTTIGSNSASFLLGFAEVGKQVRVTISYTDSEGFAESISLAPLTVSRGVVTASITGVTDDVGLLQGQIANGGLTDDPTPTISGTLSAALATGETLRIFNGTTLLGSATVNNTARTWTFSPTLPATAGTSYSITARVGDEAGNLGTASVTRTFTLDTTAPPPDVFVMAKVIGNVAFGSTSLGYALKNGNSAPLSITNAGAVATEFGGWSALAA
ncbi:MAG: Calx-beta domain-containing protein, partial [Cyanobium sp.]